ncbi:protein pelota [Nanoarchaeota archaeon]
MKYYLIDKKTIKIKIEIEEDLLYLFKIINKGDIIEGEDYRVIKFENDKEKIKVKIKIEVEEVKFSQYGDSLRISGRILEADKEVVGHYHTFDIRIGTEFILFKKDGIKKYEIKILEKAQNRNNYIFVISLDNDQIAAGIINKGIKILREDRINISKEDPEGEAKRKKIYSEYVKLINDYKIKYLCIIGPIFYPEEFYDYIKDKVNVDKILTFKVSNGGADGIYEFTRRKEYYETLKDIEIMEINKKIDEILYLMQKGYISFGIDDVYKNAQYGNIEYVLISEEYFKKMKENGDIAKIIDLFNLLDNIDAEIYFVNNNVQNYELINKFGVIGKLRYKI